MTLQAIPLSRTTHLSLLLAALLPAFLAGCSFEDEPRYNNMPASHYVKTIATSDNDRRVEKAVDALIVIDQPAVPYIIKAWREHNDAAVRCRLARALEGIGPDAYEAVPVLIEALNAIDEQQIACAAYALGGIGHAAKPATERLAELLRSTDSSTQVNLLYALGGIGEAAADQIPLVLEAAERQPTRDAAIDALSRMGEPAVRAVQPWLAEGTEEQRLSACKVLAGMGKNASLVLSGLRTALRDPYPRIRIEAAKALGAAGTYALPAHQALVYQLRDDNDQVRETVIQALIQIGPSGSKELISALQDRSWRAREGAARVIGRFSSLAEAARVPLIRSLDDPSVNVRLAVIDALSVLGESVVEDMIEQLRSDSVLRRFGGARVLGNVGPAASEALPALQKLLSDPDAIVRAEAQRAIRAIAGVM